MLTKFMFGTRAIFMCHGVPGKTSIFSELDFFVGRIGLYFLQMFYSKSKTKLSNQLESFVVRASDPAYRRSPTHPHPGPGKTLKGPSNRYATRISVFFFLGCLFYREVHQIGSPGRKVSATPPPAPAPSVSHPLSNLVEFLSVILYLSYMPCVQ